MLEKYCTNLQAVLLMVDTSALDEVATYAELFKTCGLLYMQAASIRPATPEQRIWQSSDLQVLARAKAILVEKGLV